MCSVLGAALMFVIGAGKTYGVYHYFAGVKTIDPNLKHLNSSAVAIAFLIQSLDSFLIGLVLLIFAYGVFALFVQTNEGEKIKVPGWDNAPSVGRLKKTLAEAIIVILFVTTLEEIWIRLDQLSSEVLVLPVSILLLALGISTWIFLGRNRLGQVWRDLKVDSPAVEFLRNNDDLIVIDVSEAEQSASDKGHAYFRKSPWVSSDILTSLRYGLAPADRGLVLSEDLPIWTFPADYIDKLRSVLIKVNPGLAGGRDKTDAAR
jgi:uncharacterized membrane protein YqhA